jgi:hypothetical protein
LDFLELRSEPIGDLLDAFLAAIGGSCQLLGGEGAEQDAHVGEVCEDLGSFDGDVLGIIDGPYIGEVPKDTGDGSPFDGDGGVIGGWLAGRSLLAGGWLVIGAVLRHGGEFRQSDASREVAYPMAVCGTTA